MENNWSGIRLLYGVPQGSILGPLLFNIDLIDLFFICENDDIASYADDTTPYTCARDTPTVISELQSTSEKLFNWFEKIISKQILKNVTYY